MNHIIRDQILAGLFVSGLILGLLALISIFIFASERKKFIARIVCGLAFGVAAFVVIFSPEADSTTKPLAQVGSLEPGCYAIDDVWQIGKQSCAIIRPVTITHIDPVLKQATVMVLSEHWIVCDVNDTDIHGRDAGRLFTGYAIVASTNGARRLQAYDPFK
jgi:hypothetical protein